MSLGPTEEIKWTGRRSFLSFLPSTWKAVIVFVFGVLIASFFGVLIASGSEDIGFGEACCGSYIVVFFLIVLGLVAAKMKHQYALTNKRVFARKGIVGRDINEITLDNVVNTNYSQGFLGRIFGFGDLQFNSAAGADQGVVFKGIRNPKKVNQKIKKVIANKELNDERDQQQTVNVNIGTGKRSSKEIKKADYDVVPGKERNLSELKKEDKRLPEEDRSKKESGKKFCKHCGSEIDADSKYCRECGDKV